MSRTGTNSPLTVVHGAFADSSSWAGVIERLHAKGTKVIAAANPLRGLKSDSAYVGALIDEIPGPVLAVGTPTGVR
jgi:ABC-type sugar transport system substrate-binding protein